QGLDEALDVHVRFVRSLGRPTVGEPLHAEAMPAVRRAYISIAYELSAALRAERASGCGKKSDSGSAKAPLPLTAGKQQGTDSETTRPTRPSPGLRKRGEGQASGGREQGGAFSPAPSALLEVLGRQL